MEELALSLLHTSQRQRYFEAHQVTVITNQPIKQMLNKPKALGKLEKYAVELGDYGITYEPQSAMKGHVLADHLSETPIKESTESSFRRTIVVAEKDEIEA
nr:reverse transcriptase domain-containing protein [Tanacetum cinerariifolium]